MQWSRIARNQFLWNWSNNVPKANICLISTLHNDRESSKLYNDRDLESTQIKIRAIASPLEALSSQTFTAEWFSWKWLCDFLGKFTIHQENEYFHKYLPKSKTKNFSSNDHSTGKIWNMKDFPGCPVVKTLPSNAGCAGSIPGQGAKISHASWSKNQTKNRSNIVTNSVKTLKLVHIKKFFKKMWNMSSSKLLAIDKG